MSRNVSEQIIERCMTAIQSEGYSVDDCLALYPAERAELEPLLRLVMRMQKARSLQPPAGFQASALQRLRNQAAERAPTHRRKNPAAEFFSRVNGLPLLRFSPLMVGLLIAVMLACVFGGAAVSAQALPGDFLYPVKRAQESLQLTLSADEAQRAGLTLEFASRRITEAVSLLNANRTQAIDQAVSDYDAQIQAELAYLQQDSRLSPADQNVLAGKLLAEAARHAASLAQLSAAAPAGAQAKIEAARASSQRAYQRADQIVNGPGSDSPVLPARPAPTLPAVKPSASATDSPTPAAPGSADPTQRPGPTHTGVPTQRPNPGSIVPTLTLPPPPATLPPSTGPIATKLPSRTPPPGNLPSPTLNSGSVGTRIATLPPRPTATANTGIHDPAIVPTSTGATPTKASGK